MPSLLHADTEQVDAADDEVIRLRMTTDSYADIAAAVGLATPSGAQHRYRMARARQIPSEYHPRPHPLPSQALIAWAAGFVDGEGCITGTINDREGARGRFRFVVIVAQAVREPLEEMAAAWGGSIKSTKPARPWHREQWRLTLSGREAAVFLNDLLPHLRVKFEAARVAIPFLYRVHAHRRRFSEAEAAACRVAINRLHELNRRGPVL